MKKLTPILLSCLLVFGGGLLAQNARQVPASAGSYQQDMSNTVANPIPTVEDDRAFLRAFNSLADRNPAPATTGVGKTSALGAVQLSRASNAFSVIRARTNQIVADQDNNFIGFVHRQDINQWGGTPPTTSNGVYRLDWSQDEGANWNTDIGPLTPLPYPNSGRGRYPQIGLYIPDGGANSIDDYRMPYLGALTDGNGWGNHIYGVARNITQLSADPTTSKSPNVEFDFFASGQTQPSLIASNLVEGKRGQFWSVDIKFDNNANTRLDSIFLYRGTLTDNKANKDSVTWETFKRLPIEPHVMRNPGSSDNNLQYFGSDMDFSPGGKYGWVSITADVKEPANPKDFEYDPLFWFTSDSGMTWNGPIHVKLRDFSAIVDTMATVFTDTAGNPVDTNRIPFSSTSSLTVDGNGNPHLLLKTLLSAENFNEPDSVYFIQPAAQKALWDITTEDFGQKWGARHVSNLNAHQGQIPNQGNPLTFDNFPTASTSRDGNTIFYSWTDDTSLANADFDQMQPDLHGRAYNIQNNEWTDIKFWSEDDPNFSGGAFFPQTAAEAMKLDNGDYLNPTVITSPGGGGALDPPVFFFAKNVTYSSSDFAPLPNDIAVSAITSPDTLLCQAGNEDVDVEITNMGTAQAANFTVELIVDAPSGTTDDTLMQTVNLGSPLMNGQNTTVTFSGVDLSANGTYKLMATSNFFDDQTFENNMMVRNVKNLGGTASEIFSQNQLNGCGQLVLDAGFDDPNVTVTWKDAGGNVLATAPTLTLPDDAPTFNSGDDITVEVTSSTIGCTIPPDQVTAVIDPLPQLTVTTDTAVCASGGLSLMANNNNPGGVNYAWVNNATGDTVGANNMLNLNQVADLDLTVTATDPNTGCDNSRDLSARLWGVSVDITNFQNNICAEDSFIVADDPSLFPGTEFTWLVDGDTASNLNTVNTLRGNHEYTVEVADPLGCGTASSTDSIAKWDPVEMILTNNLTGANLQSGCEVKFCLDTLERFDQAAGEALTPYTKLEFNVFQASNVDQVRTTNTGSVSTASPFEVASNTTSAGVTFSGSGPAFVQATIGSGACEVTQQVDITLVTGNDPCSNFVTSLSCTDPLEVTGREDVQLNENLALFPNPSTGVYHLNWSLESARSVNLEVVDVQGRRVLSRQLNSSANVSEDLDLSDRPAGVYILKLSTHDGVVTRRLIKQ